MLTNEQVVLNQVVAEAYSVHAETGCTPRELVEQRAELLAALQRAVANIEHWQETGTPAGPEESEAIYGQMKSAVAKARKGA